MDEKLKRIVREYGAEADENNFKMSEYYEDFCLALGVEKWRDVPSDTKLEIISEFNAGMSANRQARREFGRA